MSHDKKHDPRNSNMGSEHEPRTPSQEATGQHADEGSGPFGSDMTHMKGGTHNPNDVERAGNPYSTGTSPVTGGSATPNDPRSTYRDMPGTDNEKDMADRSAPEGERDGEPKAGRDRGLH